jgi:anti-sigma regulatory factor (Ser/Thr protein kinase)
MAIGMDPFDLELRLAPAPRAAEAARRSVDSLRVGLDDGMVDDAVLLVSELVTNSVRHAGLGRNETIRVQVHRDPSSLRVEVTDPGRGFRPAELRAAAGSEGGWGLRLLDRIADRWGVAGDDVTRVWFELDTVSPHPPRGTSGPQGRARGDRRWVS